MEKTTVLARLRYTIEFTQEAREWFQNFPDAWFARESGYVFLSELGRTWSKAIESVTEDEVKKYFSQLNIPQNYMPFIAETDTYRGSWIMEGAIVMAGTVGTSYAVLKGIAPESDLSQIVTGLTNLKDAIRDKVQRRLNREVNEALYSTATQSIRQNDTPHQPSIPTPPRRPVTTSFVIDARPILSLTPAALKSHKIHLSVAVSRDSFVLENLGDTSLTDVRIGLFRSSVQRHSWSYADAYTGQIPLVSAKQTVTKGITSFANQSGQRFDLSDGNDVHIDCWVQDNHGIYLFHFFIEGE